MSGCRCESGRVRHRGRMRAVAACLVGGAVAGGGAGVYGSAADAAVMFAASGSNAASATAASTDAIHLAIGGMVLGRVRVVAIDGDRAWYLDAAGGRGSVPLAAVASLRFGALPGLEQAESLAAAGDPQAAAAALAVAALREDPAGDWAARRVIAWLAASDPAAAIELASERLVRDGELVWVLRVERAMATVTAATPAAASPRSEAATVGRRLDRRRQQFAASPPAAFPVGAVPEARRGLDRLRDLLASVPMVDDRPGSAAATANASVGVGKNTRVAADEPVLPDAGAVRTALDRGEVSRVLTSLDSAEGPDPDTFDPRLLADLAAAAERAGRPVLAAAAWLRCAVLHPTAPQATVGWGEAARIHEISLDDPAAAARIRAHAATLADAGATADGTNLRSRSVGPAVRRR